MDRLFDNHTVNFLSKSLEMHGVQLKAIANNMANINTPGFKGTDVAFKDQLRMVLTQEQGELPLRTDLRGHITQGLPMTLEQVKPRLVVDPLTSFRSDGNNVDVDQQMATMAQNSMEINALTRLVSDRLKILRMSIEGR